MLAWTTYAWEEYLYWQSTDQKILDRINTLIKDIKRSPFEGIGKPEALKFDLVGKWSRRINDEHRLVYSINGKNEKIKDKWMNHQVRIIYQCKYHY